MTSLDTETTGLDLCHGCAPFLVTVFRDDGTHAFWEWDVDPITRRPIVPREAAGEIAAEVAGQTVVMQNAKFDVRALGTINAELRDGWRWDLTHDTMEMGHLLASNQPHNLTDMVMHWLGKDIERHELDMKAACVEAVKIARRHFPTWHLAGKNDPTMPSVEGGAWKADTWILRALARELRYPDDHPWWTLTSTYANVDSEATLKLFKAQERECRRRNLWAMYREKMCCVPVAMNMEHRGVTINGAELDSLRQEYREESDAAESTCVGIAESMGCKLTMPRGGNNASLTDFCFGPLGLPVKKRSAKTGRPSLDKEVLEELASKLPERSVQRLFVQRLTEKRSRDTALTYMDSYERFWLPLQPGSGRTNGGRWHVLHPSLNLTGTGTLRCSSSNPNEQNVSKRKGFNLRRCFGPAPGREWWSLDYQNIELRIPAYLAGERSMIDLFERPDDPPYFGSNHLLACHVLHPKLFEECRNDDGAVDGRIFKERYAATWYRWTKNGNFAVQYGAVASSGTADRAYHVEGAQLKIERRLGRISYLNRETVEFAERHGYVETVPDRTVDPDRGHPIMCTRTDRGCVLPTVPFSYKIQSTAMQATKKAMVRCHARLAEWRESDGFDGFITMQVHDELVVDLPSTPPESLSADRLVELANPTLRRTKGGSNLWRVRELQRLMEQSGDDIGIPLTVGVECHLSNWSVGESF